MATRRRSPDAPDLAAGVIAVLLKGWGAKPPADVPDPFVGFGGGWLELYEAGGAERLRREHADYLARIAREWGWDDDGDTHAG